MRPALRAVLPALLLSVLLLPTAAGALTVSLPADSAVTIGSASRLPFKVTNTDANEGLSRLALRFPSGYQVTGGSAPSGWTVEQSATAGGGSAEVVFRTTDELKCTGAVAPGSSLVFGVEVIAPPSASVSPDSLESAEAEQSCRGVALDPPAALPSWNRLGIEAALAAGPSMMGLGGVVTVTMTVRSFSTVELAGVSVLLTSSGTGSVSQMEGPTPSTLTLAPAASGSLVWTARAASPGTVSFSGQAVAKGLSSAPTRSAPLYIGDLDVSLSVTPGQAVSGQDVQVQMTVTNRGPIRVTNVTPSSLAFAGTATASAAAGPTPASLSVLEPGQSTAFAWAATIVGKGGDTYAFSGWASAEWNSIVSSNVTSNAGVLSQQEASSEPDTTASSVPLGGGGAGGGTAASAATAPAVGSGGGTTAAVPSATLQFVSVNNDGGSTGGVQFSGALVRTLRILVAWQNLSGTHSQRLELYGPDGSLYQQFSTQFAGTPVETRLPVGGTWITQNFLFGAWRVDVFLDTQGLPIASGVFLLNP